MIIIVDYGVGNLNSVKNILDDLKLESIISSDVNVLKSADKLIVPGVGAFGDAISNMKQNGIYEFIKHFVALGKPVLGICLGMQLFFETSYENGVHNGFGFLSGKIVKFGSQNKVPHMGWNNLHIKKGNGLLKGLSENEYAYFVHSYYAIPSEDIIDAYTDYGLSFPSVVSKGNVFGCQFHPEKSGECGRKILMNFGEM